MLTRDTGGVTRGLSMEMPTKESTGRARHLGKAFLLGIMEKFTMGSG